VTRDELTRKLRDLRRLERRVRGLSSDEPADVWRRYFSLAEGARVRYPFMMMLAFDRTTRERVIREYLFAVWTRTVDPARESDAASADAELLAALGIEGAADPATVRSAFRRLALELHPDAGGDDELMRTLIEQYRASSYG
jgi:hypothetical protein